MGESLLKKSWGSLVTILLVIILVLIWQYVPLEDVLYLVNGNIVYVILIYILLHIVLDLFPPISTFPLFITGFYIMGDWLYLAEFISLILCSIINFHISRKWGLRFLSLFVSENGIKKIKEILRISAHIPLLKLRLFTFSFNDLAAYAYGLTSIKFSKYLISSIFTSLFWLLIWKYIFKYTIVNISIFFVWFWVVSIPFFVISYMYYKKKKYTT